MSIDALERLKNMPQFERVASLILLADVANKTILSKQPNTFYACNLALKKCRDWNNGGNITPEEISDYVDGEESENPWMQESVFACDSEGLHALIFITMVVGHFAYLAYLNASKPEQMSEIIAEAGENIFEAIVEYAERYGLSELIKQY